MPMTQHAPGDRLDDEYEDLLGLWSDLESALSVLLARPLQVQDFSAKVRQCDRWLQDLVAHDIDAALYLMFQLAATSSVGYSTSHALVCGTLCHILAQELPLPPHERDSLVRAAFTMNIGMTALQDELADQRERPSAAQQQAIDTHPQRGVELLEQLEVRDDLWLDVIGQHHLLPERTPESQPLQQLVASERLSRVLATIDRYAAMISPRKSRAGRSATDSVRAIVGQDADQSDEVGFALVRTVGLCPPGTFVRLDNGETAVVLRRGEKPNFPLVASLIDTAGEQRAQPDVYPTSQGSPRIQSALARSAVPVELNHRTMVRLGLYAARGTPTALVRQP
ncbi:HD-GYP domain-containing protein [Acidovorax sp. Leaf160]|uniref:HD-GYP domain-containing protein n=1 Tax=Acidovorax sp. Leaf160 TaxID=1736280 RepID=UPI0006FCBA41|nr:HD domain-containing phosphohydrolase [Acidovorax sp. Leaf160]KQR55321.1 phosphodiesterase [Acidovorax sp. Leaf160]